MAFQSACLVPVILDMFTWTLSATTLAAIAVDRYVCILHSLRYYEFMNTRYWIPNRDSSRKLDGFPFFFSVHTLDQLTFPPFTGE